MTRYAQNTEVTSDRSRSEIERTRRGTMSHHVYTAGEMPALMPGGST